MGEPCADLRAGPGRCLLREACWDRRRPCEALGRVHAAKLRLCDELEALADDLPARVDPLRCRRLASELVPLLREGHRYEEGEVFPILARRPGGAEVVARLCWEHVEDAAAAEELTEVLLLHGRGQPLWNPEALGWMLRALFASLRRHVAAERLLLRPPGG